MWERACSRRRCVSRHINKLIYRFREQARSYRGRSKYKNNYPSVRITGRQRSTQCPSKHPLLPLFRVPIRLPKATATREVAMSN
ncbi:hypothetical protein DKY63_07970 [Pseudomonas putida]|uniref:Uncharacterized protein n=1 Tax=Pseudomonas putida TaxID=303 RepID=A0A2Z4RG67_PSEPU|nr:hypothetical protein DKY63_07970 [Pseudomonas putida]